MNTCRAVQCVAGSKVSYSIFAPDKTMDFNKFMAGQKKVAAHLQKRANKGVKITLEKAEKTKDRFFTFFTSYRKMQSASGSRLYTLSTLVYGKNFTISIISSSKTKKIVEANRALFLVGLMTLDQVKKQ